MADPITIFRGTSGLNTVADPARIPMAENAISDVAEIVNMRIDQYNRPSRRPSFELIQAGSFHSLFNSGNSCFIIQTRTSDDAIMKLNSDHSLTGIASGLDRDRRMAWCKHGDIVYFSNGNQKGKIILDSVYDWLPGNYYGPETTMDFSIPEDITHLEIHSGRMYVSVGNVLYWSEQHRFDLFNLGGSEFHGSFAQFYDPITMIQSVSDGLYIGTEKETYFLTGNDPKDFTSIKAADFPVIEWTDAANFVDARDLGFDPGFDHGLCVLWASPEGAIIGFSNGIIMNLNKEKIIYPENTVSGFGCLVGYEFIHGMK